MIPRQRQTRAHVTNSQPDGSQKLVDASVPTRVAICALTLERPRGLDALLRGIDALIGLEPAVDVSVVIVDNDSLASARSVVEVWQSRMRWPLTYAVEERRGIPFGRNRAVAIAGVVDFIAFIDDDEVPDPEWLAELLRVQALTGADVVTGAVLGQFESPPPRWAVDGEFFERRRRPTGTFMEYARTSNVLIARHVFPDGPAPFNETMGSNGGDDTHFFMRARLQGFRIAWADDAIVREEIPTSRVSSGWLLRRAYRRGNTLSLCLRDLNDSPIRRFRRTLLALFRIAQGTGLAAVGIARGKVVLLRGLQQMCLGAGLLTGLAGLRYDEYTTVHGR